MPVRLCVGTKYITEKDGLMGLTEDAATSIVWNIETTEDDCVIFVSPPSGRRRKDRHLVPKNAQTTEDGRGVACAPLDGKHAPEAELGVRKWKIHPDGSCMWYPTDTDTSAPLFLGVRGSWVIMTKEPCVWTCCLGPGQAKRLPHWEDARTVSEVTEVTGIELLQLENTRLLVEVATLRERLAAIGSIVGNC